MPLAIVTAPDEGRVQGDDDGRGGGRRFGHGGVATLLAHLEGMAAQCLGALSRLHRQKMCEHRCGDPIRHQGGQVRAELVQLRCRPTVRGPVGTSLDPATANAEEARQPHGHPAEQRRYPVRPQVFDMTSSTASRAVRPQDCMIPRLRGDHRLLNARQNLLRLRQRQSQMTDIPKAFRPADLQHIDTPCPAVGAALDQPQYPSHAQSPSRRRPDQRYNLPPDPPISRHSPSLDPITMKDKT